MSLEQRVYLQHKFTVAYKQHYRQSGCDKEAVRQYATHTVHTMVQGYKSRRGKDILSVLTATASSTLVPFSGVAVMVAYVVVLCVARASDLGLIPVADILASEEGVVQTSAALAKNIITNIKNAAQNGIHAAVETAVFEVLKKFGGDILWEEVLKSVIIEIFETAATDAAWILTPLLLPIKYKLHRHHVKHMYERLGAKAQQLHWLWINQDDLDKQE